MSLPTTTMRIDPELKDQANKVLGHRARTGTADRHEHQVGQDGSKCGINPRGRIAE